MKDITFYADSSKVTEGDIVEIRWTANNATSVRLTIDNGHHSNSQIVTASDSKKFRLNRPGTTKFILTIDRDGKQYNKTLRVKVRKMKPVKATPIDDHGKRLSDWKMKWQRFRNRIRYNWSGFSQEKKLAYRILLILGAFVALSLLLPVSLSVGICVVIGYLVWYISKH